MNKIAWKRAGVLCCTFWLLATIVGAQTGAGSKEARFKNPPMDYRMNRNTHEIPTQHEAQDALLDKYLAGGYGGLATNANWTEGYLKNKDELDSFFRFVRTARQKGMEVWLYDEEWYPSGMAGGYIIQEHPEWESEGLLSKDTVVSGGTHLRMPLTPGSLLALEAMPIEDGSVDFDRGIDLRHAATNGVLEWDVPGGSWKVVVVSSGILFNGFQAGGMDRGGKVRHYPSLLVPEVTERFIELTHQKYADHLGDQLGTLFFSTFTDEPSAMAVAYSDLGYGVFPWKANVSAEFKRRYGYELNDHLVRMMGDEGGVGQRLRVQYFSIIADFMSTYYFRQIKEYCHAQDFRSGGHLLLEETMLAHVPLYGDIMACYREMDIPGIDNLTAMPDLTRRYLCSGRLAASAAELAGNSMVMSEICPIYDYSIHNGNEAPLLHIKGTVNRQLVAGVTKFNNYLQLSNEDDATKTEFNNYVARVCEMMSGGVRASRIGVYYPIETMWAKFMPASTSIQFFDEIHGRDREDRAQLLDQLFIDLSDVLYDHQFEFSYLDAKGVLDASLEGRQLSHGELKYDVLILPGVETIPEEVMRKIAGFCRQGGQVIFIESLPENSLTEFPSAAVKEAVVGMPAGNIRFEPRLNRDNLVEWLDRIVEQDLEIWPNRNILCSHKSIDGQNVYLVTNDNAHQKDLKVSLKSGQPVRCWNPQTGDVTPLIGNSLFLGPYESMILTY